MTVVGTPSTVLVAQAEGGDALQQGVIVDVPAAAPAAAEPTEAHEGVEAHEAVVTHEGTEVPHGGAHATFPPFDPSHFASQALWLALTFGFLYVLVSRAALPRIGGILEQRRVRIEGDLKEADRLRLEVDRAIQSYEAALAEARQRAHGIAEETRQSIKADLEGKRTSVESDLSAKVAKAEADIARSKAASLENVDDIAAEIAGELVARISGEVTPKAARDAVAAVAKE